MSVRDIICGHVISVHAGHQSRAQQVLQALCRHTNHQFCMFVNELCYVGAMCLNGAAEGFALAALHSGSTALQRICGMQLARPCLARSVMSGGHHTYQQRQPQFVPCMQSLVLGGAQTLMVLQDLCWRS